MSAISVSVTRAGRRPVPLLVLEAMRPRQWTKNAFVLAALLFAGKTLELVPAGRASAAFAAFCLASGATYLLNDTLDAEADRASPRTAGRPIARGDLTRAAALAAAAAAAAGALAIAAALGLATAGAVAGYLALQVAYSHQLKHLLFVDVLTIAAGFVLRAVAGGTAIAVAVSSWLLVATGLLAVFLGLMKRRGECVAVARGAAGRAVTRANGVEHYSLQLVDQLIAVVTPGILVVYVLYAATGAASEAMLLTVPFVLYGIFRLLLLIHHDPGESDDPSVVLWRDRPLAFCVLGWAIVAAVISLLTR